MGGGGDGGVAVLDGVMIMGVAVGTGFLRSAFWWLEGMGFDCAFSRIVAIERGTFGSIGFRFAWRLVSTLR